MRKKDLPSELGFIPVSTALIKTLCEKVRSSIDDATCLGCWIDSEEFEVSNYISTRAFFSFKGFSEALIKDLNSINEICKSLDLSLDLHT